MFCPKCGIGNLIDQKFCRGCGHALTGHRTALESSFEEAVENIKSGTAALAASAAVLIILSALVLGVWIFQKDAGALFILIPMLAFAIPATTIGLIRLNRAYRELSPARRDRQRPVIESKMTTVQLAPGATTDSLALSANSPASITEHTTLDLKSADLDSDELHGNS
jgi:hypothetical protein